MPISDKRAILGSATADLGSIAAGARATTTVPVNGAKVGQVVTVSSPTLEAGLTASGHVSAAGVVTVSVTNATAAPVDPASQTFHVAVH